MTAFILLTGFISLPAKEATIKVKAVKIEIDEAFYSWEDINSIPIKDQGEDGATAPSTVLSFTKFYPGIKMTDDEFKREIFRTERRLEKSNFFYSCSVMDTQVKENSEEKNIIISVTDGYRSRFGGGNAYGFFGTDNLNGRRKSFRIFAGYNYAGGEFNDYLFMGSNMTAGISAYYIKSDRKLNELIKYNSGEATVSAGFRMSPDTSLTASYRIKYMHTEYINHNKNVIENENDSITHFTSLTFGNETFFKNPAGIFSVGMNIKPEYVKPQKNLSGKKYSGELFLKQSFGGVSISMQFSGGISQGNIAFSDKYNIFCTPDKSVRSGYHPEELIGRNFAMSNTEIRINTVSFLIASVLDFRNEIFLFCDLAYMKKERSELFESDIYDAYGAGTRFLFDTPVFAYFTLTYGVNRNKNGRFIFFGTAGF